MLKKYKIGFDVWGLLLFLMIMIPNFIWFAIPAPNDVLRTSSITETIDTVASACQVLMVAVLCILRNRESKKLCVNRLTVTAAVYYAGIANEIVILGLTMPPCLAFFVLCH